MKEDKEKYEAPLTKRTQVNLEQGFMNSSVFDPDDHRDDGVSVEGHEVGNTGDYTDLGWDNNGRSSDSAW